MVFGPVLASAMVIAVQGETGRGFVCPAPSGRCVMSAIRTWGVAPGYAVMALQAICELWRTVSGQGARGTRHCPRSGTIRADVIGMKSCRTKEDAASANNR